MKTQYKNNQGTKKLSTISQFETLNTSKLGQISGGRGFSAFAGGYTNTVGKKLSQFFHNLF
ncbi:ComC/BlpC family leader-containing pheromone/bacteriocin [Agrilactobacillus fermenti]|uniref:ComC/BlpC family leader-containing pheromone/bacteriocin n=1 Tax=Agrilactobacillus fermenti TaxID=2586909 RepID=UPI003A5BE6E4